MNTLRNRLKTAKQLLKSTYDTTLIFAVVCTPTSTFDDAIDFFQTIEEARECIKGINEEYILTSGRGVRMHILPTVVDADSYEPVTEENMNYYSLDSEWVKNFKKEMEDFRENLKNGIIS